MSGAGEADATTRRGAMRQLAVAVGRTAALALGGGVLAGGTAGCGAVGRASRLPIEQVSDDRACARTLAPVLAVLLPGVGMTPDDLLREGFFDAVRRRGLAADLLIAHTTLAHVQDGDVLVRLQREVIAPARGHGYARVWLIGISLGGYLAMLYAQAHPDEVEGVLAIAPYLGRRQWLQAIEEAGGPARWRAGLGDGGAAAGAARDAADLDLSLWRGLTARGPGAPALQLAYGTEDRFAPAHRLLAQALPPADVLTAPGGHDWPPWRALWSRWLDRGAWPAACPG